MEPDPPFLKTYKALFDSQLETSDTNQAAEAEECDLPLIDLSRLNRESESEQCKKDIMAAASEWGFFQVVNHGVSSTLLHRIRELQVNVFQLPFVKKASEKLLDLSPENYRWGSPRPTSVRQLSWSEAYHIPLTPANGVTKTSTRYFQLFLSFSNRRYLLYIPGRFHIDDASGKVNYLQHEQNVNLSAFWHLNSQSHERVHA